MGSKIRRVSSFAALIAFFLSPSAHAQICAGRSSFNLAPTHVEFEVGMNGSGNGAGATIAHGTDLLFGIATAVTHSAGGNARVHTISGAIGTDQPLSPDNKLHICPVITVGYVSGSAAPVDRDGRIGFSVAGDASMLIVNKPQLRIMPTIGLELRYRGVGRTAAVFPQDLERFRTLTGGIGFVVWNRLTVVPRVVVPLGPVDQTGVALTVAYNLLR
jgi:hypothetical protein